MRRCIANDHGSAEPACPDLGGLLLYPEPDVEAGAMSQRLRRARTRSAWILLGACVIGWPVTAVLEWLGVPIFKQTMLALSWLGVILIAADLLTTSQVHEEQGNGD